MTDDEARNLWDDCCFNDKFTQFIPMTNIEIDRDFPTTLHEDMPSLEEVEREDWKAYHEMACEGEVDENEPAIEKVVEKLLPAIGYEEVTA